MKNIIPEQIPPLCLEVDREGDHLNEKMKKEDDKDSEQKKVMIHDIPDAEKSKDYRNVETQEFSGSQHRNEAPSHHDDDHDEDQYTNDTIPDSLKYDPDKFDIEFVIPKRRSRK